jgi:hypothetical protein
VAICIETPNRAIISVRQRAHMAEINVVALNETAYQVTVVDKTTTSHEVTVQADYALKLTAGKIQNASLVKASFEFLLAREPNTSILRSFDLSVIARYFPEYENSIKKMI